MKKWFIILTVFSLVLILAAGTAFAAGFRVPEAGAKAMGMANAFVGQADDPSAVQMNPAGITQLDGNTIMFGGTYIKTANEYTSTVGTASDAEDKSFYPPFFFYTNHLGEGNAWLGLGITSPFGLGTEWRVPSFEFIVTKTSLELVKVNPTIAYKASDTVSLAFGVDYYDALEALFENEAMLPGPTPAYQQLLGDGDSYGFNIGALVDLSDEVKLGFTYRTGTTLDISGKLDITIDATGTSAPTYPVNVTVDVDLPATAALALSYQPDSTWTLNVDLDWTGWSAYKELNIKSASSGATLLLVPKNYDDTIAYRVGGEYVVSDTWALRGGFLIDSSPVPVATYDPRLPDGDRWGVSFGAGYDGDAWDLDLAYMYVKVKEENIDNAITDGFGIGQTVDGKYEGSVNLVGVSLTRAF